MSAHAEDMVLVPWADLDALQAENRRLRREAGDREAVQRIRSDSGEGCTFTRDELAEAWGISSKSQSRRLPTRFPKRTRCRVPTVSIFRRTA